MRITEEFVQDLMRMRYKAEFDPAGYKELKDKWTHGISCELDSKVKISMNEIFDKFFRKYGKFSVQFMSLLKVGVGIEYDSKEVAEIYKRKNETPPAYDLTLRASCYDENILKVMNEIILEKKVPDGFKNTQRFIDRCRMLAGKYVGMVQPKVYRLRNGSATRIKNAYNIVDITGVVFHNENYSAPSHILDRLKVIRKEYWDTLDISSFGDTHGMHFIVPGKECKILREVYAMDPEVQLDGKAIAEYMRFVAKGFDTNATLEQYRWISKCIEEEWNKLYWIISTDMEKYSDSLNRLKLIDILILCGILYEEEREELNRFWGLDVYDRDKKVILRNSDSVKQGQYSIFDAMTIANMFLQCIVYDLLEEDNEYRDKNGKIRNKNSALGDDTVLAFINEQKKGLYVVQEVFGYVGVKISKSKTHIMSRGRDYINGEEKEDKGFIDFAKRMVTEDGLLSYVSANAISKDNFDDYVMEYYRILEEDPELAEEFGRMYLKDRFSFIANLHKINGGRRIDAITDSDMILFEYKLNRLVSQNRVKPHELEKQLRFIKSQGIMLSNTKLLGWLPDYDGDDAYMPNERDDEIIIANIMNYLEFGRDLDFIPSEYVGKTWEEVKDDPLFEEVLNTMRVAEMDNKRTRKAHVYDDMSKLNLKEFRHNLFIFESSSVNRNGNRDYQDMKYEALVKKLHTTFRRCVESSSECLIYNELSWMQEKRTLRFRNRRYRLYSLSKPNSRSLDLIPFEVFKYICKDCFVNKDMEAIYKEFIDSLPPPVNTDEYYIYF